MFWERLAEIWNNIEEIRAILEKIWRKIFLSFRLLEKVRQFNDRIMEDFFLLSNIPGTLTL